MQITTTQEIDFNYENIKIDMSKIVFDTETRERQTNVSKHVLAIQQKNTAQKLVTKFLSRLFPVTVSRIQIKTKYGRDSLISTAMLALSLKRKINMRGCN
jgi:hypothetical protein